MQNCDLVVIGASAGGVEALQKLVALLPADLPAALFVVIHIPTEPPSQLGHILDRAGPLTAKTAEDDEPIRLGHIYVAPPDYHLLVKPGRVCLHRGPRENRHRPAIDPLFRSAAIAYQSRVIGVVLTGYLDDGTSGLLAVKRCGGTAIVQDPADALHPDMPKNALAAVEVDYQLPLSRLGKTLAELVRNPAQPILEVPSDIITEARIAEHTMSDIASENRLGHLVPYSCPECNGPLWQIDTDKVRRYRCHMGHGFTAKALAASQDAALEQALWEAMRTLEERAMLCHSMAGDEENRGRPSASKTYRQQAEESSSHAEVIRELLLQDKPLNL